MSDNNPLGSLFLSAVSRFGNRSAIKTSTGDITYSQLHQMVINFTLHLANCGATRGSTIALHIVKDSVLASVAILAVTFLGGRWVQFDRGLREQRAIRVARLLHNKPGLEGKPGRTHVDKSWYTTPDNYRSRSNFNFAGYESAEDTWFFAVSSGTTGTKKYMPVSGRMFHERILRLSEYSETGEDFRVTDFFRRASNLASLHFFHTLHLGGTYVFSDDYNYLADQEVKLVVGSPTHLSTVLANVAPHEKPRMPEVRVVGGALYPQFLAELLKFFKNVRVSYGSTEAGPTTTRLITQYTSDRSVGPCYFDVAVEIVDEKNNSLNAEAEGVVRIKASSQVKSYVDNIEASEEAFHDGWFYPGDLGRLSLNGDLYIVGRLKDQLNIAGLKINAAMIDEQIQSLEQIREAMCFVEFNDRGNEALAALIAIEPSEDVNEVVKNLLEFIKGKPNRSKFPARFYQVEAIPRNDNGKIMRHKAMDMVDGLERITASNSN
jgi:acyl-CoA synthetase (AMP-forming)/AMP-acid ligase II